MNFQDVRKNAMQRYIKYKTYYDEKQMLRISKNVITSMGSNLK